MIAESPAVRRGEFVKTLDYPPPCGKITKNFKRDFLFQGGIFLWRILKLRKGQVKLTNLQ